MIEQRRYARTPIGSPLQFSLKGDETPYDGIARDVSLGGMFVETASPAPFNAEIVIRVVLPGSRDTLTLPGVVRWHNASGMGVQFGNLGARETVLITEIGRQND